MHYAAWAGTLATNQHWPLAQAGLYPANLEFAVFSESMHSVLTKKMPYADNCSIID